MSSISGVSSSTALSQTRAVRNDNDADDQQRKADFTKALVAGGADPSQVNTIQAQIQQAIADAVKNGGQSQRPDPSTIKNAVDSVLKANGIDVTKFQSSIDASKAAGGAHRGGHKHGHKSGNAQQSQQAGQSAALQLVQDDPSKGNQIDTAA